MDADPPLRGSTFHADPQLAQGAVVRFGEPPCQCAGRPLHGPYDEGSSTNISFHRWAADLTGAFSYFWQDGWQGNLAVGLTVNGENPATDYTTGNELHFEGALAKGLGAWTVGLAGCHYSQVTGDSGVGAVLGDFKGRVSGVGPTVAWTGAWDQQPVIFGASYFHEFDEENRVPGNILVLNLTFQLGHGATGARPGDIGAGD